MDTNVTPLPVDLNNLKFQDGRDFESSQIHGFEYGTDGRLYVQFKSNGNRTTYAYKETTITPEIAAAAEAAESKGKFFGKPFTSVHTDFDRLPGTTQQIRPRFVKAAAVEGEAQE